MAISPLGLVGSGHDSTTFVAPPSASAYLSHAATPVAPSADTTVSAHGALPAAQPGDRDVQHPPERPALEQPVLLQRRRGLLLRPALPTRSTAEGSSSRRARNNLPTYLNGFWMNVTTNVAMINAVVTMWGTSWPNATVPQPGDQGLRPARPDERLDVHPERPAHDGPLLLRPVHGKLLARLPCLLQPDHRVTASATPEHDAHSAKPDDGRLGAVQRLRADRQLHLAVLRPVDLGLDRLRERHRGQHDPLGAHDPGVLPRTATRTSRSR